VEEEDAFGAMVNYTTRVQSRGKGAEISLSDRAYADIQQVRAKAHRTLKWIDHNDCELKGFTGRHRLWELAAARPTETDGWPRSPGISGTHK
jgi:class 3 adenylate cyclase